MMQKPCLCAFQSHSSGSLLDIGTRRIFNEDHDMFRETARKYFEEHVKPYHGVRPIQRHRVRRLFVFVAASS
jgi:hypothetical protein